MGKHECAVEHPINALVNLQLDSGTGEKMMYTITLACPAPAGPEGSKLFGNQI